ncbi:metal-dependent transcriptional regulator [Anaerosolibacter sp.]|uniref:metal-dependent transcriptional regulator n=1 Tax=Anaerosolibacter sp. TaxID=1872527 RepID=UPI0039F0F8E4
MEDYLEMIYILSFEAGFTRINELSDALNAQPPSGTRMVQKLAEINLVNCKKYEFIALTEYGKQRGRILLARHKIIESFLKALGVSKSIFEETERIKHTVNKEILACIQDYLNFPKEKPDIVDRLENYKCKKTLNK